MDRPGSTLDEPGSTQDGSGNTLDGPGSTPDRLGNWGLGWGWGCGAGITEGKLVKPDLTNLMQGIYKCRALAPSDFSFISLITNLDEPDIFVNNHTFN